MLFDSGRSLGPQRDGSSLSENKSPLQGTKRPRVGWVERRPFDQIVMDTPNILHICSWPGKNIQCQTSRDRAHNTTSQCCICAGHSQCFCFSESLSGSVGHDGTTPPPSPKKEQPAGAVNIAAIVQEMWPTDSRTTRHAPDLDNRWG